jgi:hypothetical protein
VDIGSILLSILRTFLPQDDFHLTPDIPPRKLAGACRSCQVPADETIFALIDATVTGTGRCSLLFCSTGLYYFNDHGTRVPGPGMISYASLVGRRLFRESWAEVCLDRGEFFNRAGSQVTAEKLLALLQAVQSALFGSAS